MPENVVERLKEGKTVAEEFDDMPILFADIVGFTNFSSNKTPKEVISVLYELFKRFDNLCEENQCYKVCTIGDCYVAIGYNGKEEISIRNPQKELINILNFGFGMISAISELNQIQEGQLQMRIGVHIGKIIGGISGSNIIRYDIYGPDVLIANKMESNGQAGFINVSSQVKEQLQKQNQECFEFQFNKTAEIERTSSEPLVKIDCFFISSERKAKKSLQ